MGGGGSKQTLQSDVVTSLISNITNKHMQSCMSTSAVSQVISITDSSYVNITGNRFRQKFKVTMNCSSSIEDLETLQNDIANAISQSGAQTTQAVLSAINSMVGEKDTIDNLSKIKNQVKTDVTKETIMQIQTSINANQGIVVEGSDHISITNNSQEQIADQVTDIMNKTFNNTSLVNEMKNQETQQAKQDQRNPIADTVNAIGDAGQKILNGLGNLLTAPLFAILLFIFVIIAAIVLKRKLLGDSPSYGYDSYDAYNSYDVYDTSNAYNTSDAYDASQTSIVQPSSTQISLTETSPPQ